MSSLWTYNSQINQSATMNRKPYFFSTLFAISMAYFESAIVVYLRQIAYPNGFKFPLQSLNQMLATTEVWREMFSVIMLFAVACLISKKRIERFAWFIFNFAIWDIFYYLFLKLLLGWPESFLTMDILFLIPIIWTGPVIAPIILSVLMIALALFILKFTKRNRQVYFNRIELLALIAGSLVSVLSFTLDYIHFYSLEGKELKNILSLKSNALLSNTYEPEKFYWGIFITGVILIITGILIFFFRNKKLGKSIYA